MYSLKKYSEQCYNIGSPQPSPTRSPFQDLPPNKDLEFKFSPSSTEKLSPLKIKVSRIPRKRKLASSVLDTSADNTEVSPKKARIMDKKVKEEFMAFLAKQCFLWLEYAW